MIEPLILFGGPGESYVFVPKITFQARKTEFCVPKFERAAQEIGLSDVFCLQTGARSAPKKPAFWPKSVFWPIVFSWPVKKQVHMTALFSPGNKKVGTKKSEGT